MTTKISCSRDRLQQLLGDSLTETEEQALAAHLADCGRCREELESLAGEPSWWTETSQRLRVGAEFSLTPLDSSFPSDDDAAHFATDFAVDFLEPSDDPQVFGRLGEYEIVEIIGRGGMGIVLKGFQRELHRHVAVKVLSPHLATSGAARRRFAREAQATAAVVHPHVMAIHSVNATAKLPYLVMPFVACESLQQRLDRKGPLEVVDILRIGLQAAGGLAAAHAQGLVHRDVKPANILLETNVDRVLLTDFGLARAVDDATLTRTGIIAGTPQYMSPEQANGDAVDHRSDLFSLGSALYAMCTGRPPFRAETTFGVLRRIRETQPRDLRDINPDIPVWLDRIVQKLLAKDAVDRFDTAEDVARLLEQCLAHVQQPTAVPLPDHFQNWPLVPPSLPSTSPRRLRVRSLLPMSAALLMFALSIAWFLIGPRNGKQPADLAPPVSTVNEETSSSSPATDVPLDWNATQTQLDEIQHEVDHFETEQSADLEWSAPSASAPNSSEKHPE